VSAVANVGINVDARGATAQLRQLQTQAGQTERAFGGLTAANSDLVSSLARLTASYIGLRTAQSAFQSGIQRAESERRLQFLTQGYGELAQAQEAAARAARTFGLSTTDANQQFAQLYGRLRPLNVSLSDIEAAFVGFNTAAKASGTSAAETAGAMLQLTQALGSGVLRGQELNSVLEQAPGLVVALTRELGQPISQIRKLAEEGKITSDVVIRALKRAGADGAGQLEAAMNGPAQAIKNLQNEFQDFQVAATEDLIPALVKAVKGLREVLVSLGPTIKGIGQIAASTLGTLSDLINAVSKPQAYAAKQAIQGGRLPMFGLGGYSGAEQLFLGTSGAGGVGLSGLRAEAQQLVKHRRQPVNQILLELMQNRLQRMEGKGAAAAAAPAPIPSLLGGTAAGGRVGGGGKAGGGLKSVEDAVKRGVIGGLTGGGQGDASRGRSTGPHLHAQLVSGGNLERLVDAALDFGGGRTASSFGLGRGAAAHGYPGRDYYTPQGTRFTLRPGYSASDLGIQGALGRGMRIKGPGGIFELGHLAGVQMGTVSGKGAAADMVDAQQAALDAINQSLAAGQKLSQEFSRQIELRTAASKLERDLLQIGYDQQDRQQQINELTDAGQRVALTGLNNQIQGLATLNAQLNNIYERAGFTPGAMFGDGAGAFRTDINLDPLAKASPIEEYAKRLKDLQDPINQAKAGAEAIGDAFNDAFSGIISGTQTTQEALSNLFRGIATSFMQMATQMITEMIKLYIFKQLTGLLGVSGGGGGMFSGASVFSSGAASFNPASFGADLNLFPARAMGGPVTAGQSYLVGERKPELFTPSVGGTISNKVLSGTTTVTVNVDASGTSVQGDDQQANQLGRIIGAAVQAELVKAKRRGGILNP
jgi:tape measure domain-containing protein